MYKASLSYKEDYFRAQGMRVRADGPQLISELIRKTLRIECGVLMGMHVVDMQ